MKQPTERAVFCAWCPTYGRKAKLIRFVPGKGMHGSSHGICPQCKIAVLTQALGKYACMGNDNYDL